MRIGIIDVHGLPYDGTTLNHTGIGGSESSIISVSRELTKLGFSVTVFNDNNKQGAKEGIYDGVEYCEISRLLEKDFKLDIVISQRSVVPFAPQHLYESVKQPPPRNYTYETFQQLQKPHQLKVLWLQDTFCWGDHILESLVVKNYINDVFTLSDWHTAYITHNQHGPRRNVEVLKSKIFQTRNAINRWIDWVDVKKKDPNLFVYNASVTKGMVPLLERIWPRLKQKLPNARLKVIGGYYQFPNEPLNDAGKQLQAFQEKYKDDPSVEFTGIIPQPQIAEIMAAATYNIYPGAFPETSGISTLESINYNTPVFSTRFGASEETATELASYFIDYAIQPNVLFPHINIDKQVDKFVDMVLRAVNNPYLHQQKQYACNAVKDVSTWDTVALQWKQHFYNRLGIALSSAELAQVKWINYRVHKVFGRRISNPEEIIVPRITVEQYLPPYPDNRKVKLAIVDIPGMSYDGSTLDRRGLGGSESAAIYVAEELQKIGFDVTVFNGCDEDDSTPGVYNGVAYKPVHEIANDACDYDVVISSRTVMPFVTEPFYGLKLKTSRQYPYDLFKRLRENAKLKIFWMHDTFSWGDDVIEDLVIEKAVDEIWCLSDFHSMYVMNCNHGKPRNYEVLRRHMWITRNGIKKYFDTVDLAAKDPNLFFFNANMSKGLRTLLHVIWPRVKQEIPSAKLKVIGGFYKLGTAFNDDQEKEFKNLVGDKIDDPSIEFTGVVDQKTVAEIAKQATYFLYPAELPETYGISCLESLYANTPLLTCRFGALEETATEYSHMIDYAVIPNGLYPQINAEKQADAFVKMVVEAYKNPEELFRRQLALNEIKELAGWDVTALEWKQHIYSKLGLYLQRGEFQKANYYTAKYHKIFKRRITGLEFWTCPKLNKENKIVVISPFYNAEKYIARCIESVATQDYDNYIHYLIDDASTDNSFAVAKQFLDTLPQSLKNKFMLIKNVERSGSAVANQITAVRNLNLDDNDIVMLLDGDDSLVNKNDIFTYYNELHKKSDFVYGSCWSMVDSIPLISQPYPPAVIQNKSFRDYKFNWNMPYTHLRTFKAGLIKYIPESAFKDSNGNWFKAGGDNATFYGPLENCDPTRIYVNTDIIYNYNDTNPLNDYKVNAQEQNQTAQTIRINKTMKKKILIAIPTAKNIEVETFKSIYDLIVPDGYETYFQYFYGYNIDQVRNLIADWVVKGYDYLFSVDSDIAFAPDTLVKLLSHNKDVVSGLYIQRKHGEHILELYQKNQRGGVSNIPYNSIQNKGLIEVAGCGFGCVLVKQEVLKQIGYPQFQYYSALDHKNTISEDVDFCRKALEKGFTIWADTSILCDHKGVWTFKVDAPTSNQANLRLETDSEDYHVLENAVKLVKGVPGMICEIGTRRGGSTKLMIDTLLANGDLNRNFIALDPYGNIEYNSSEGRYVRYDYDNSMRNETLTALYTYVQNKPVNLVLHVLEDTEFFERFKDGVVFYNNHKVKETDYSCVFFDGPHSLKSTLDEMQFFLPRSPLGAVWILDDIHVIPYDAVKSWLFSNGFELVEQSKVKASFRKVN